MTRTTGTIITIEDVARSTEITSCPRTAVRTAESAYRVIGVKVHPHDGPPRLLQPFIVQPEIEPEHYDPGQEEHRVQTEEDQSRFEKSCRCAATWFSKYMWIIRETERTRYMTNFEESGAL